VTRFTAEDMWPPTSSAGATSVEGNSMATRMGALVDSDTGRAREGAIVVWTT
jgi:peptide/nickel transport system substrate-binding protein